MKYIAYIVATLVGLMFSYMGFIFAMLAGPQSAYLIGALLLVAYAGVVFFLVRKDRDGKGLQFAFVLALPMLLVTVVLQVFALGSYAYYVVAALLWFLRKDIFGAYSAL